MKFQLPTAKRILLLLSGVIFIFLLRHVEVDSLALKSIIDRMLWLSIPGFLYKFIDGKTSVYRDMLMIAVFGIYILITCFLGLGVIICSSRNVNIEYVSKCNKSVVILRRGFVCLGTEYDYSLVKQRKLSDHLTWITDFNESPVDTALWQKWQ